MATYGFNEGDAKRIGKVVRQVERMPAKVKLGGPERGGASPGVRIMLGTVGTATWNKRTSKVVMVYGGEPGVDGLPPNSAGTVLAWNIMASITTAGLSTATTSRWVQLSNNGFGWYAQGVECDE